MFRIRSCTAYTIRTVYISVSNRNGHLHVHAIHVIHMLIQFMSYHSCGKGYWELFFFTVFDRPRLSENERNQAIGMLAGGMSASVIARRFGCCRKTSDRLAARYQQTGAIHDRQRPGRPRLEPIVTLRWRTYVNVNWQPKSLLGNTVSSELEKGWLEPSFVHRWISVHSGISWAAKHELTIRLTMFAILHGRYNRNGGISPNALVLRYVTSMRRRIIACIHANGGHIRY